MAVNTTTHTTCVVGVFDDASIAQRASEELVQRGFEPEQIEVATAGRFREQNFGSSMREFFHRLLGADALDEQRGHFAEAIRRGSAILTVTANQDDVDRVADVMDEHGAIDIDKRVESWRQRGYTGYDPNATPYAEPDIRREQENYRAGLGQRRDQTIPVVREEVHIGKRAVQRGGVRIFNKLSEEPVRQAVSLRQEHVRVERRPADRPATASDLRARDEVIEVTEMVEEPVVSKRARVVEEVVVNKEVNERTEMVDDTVRRNDVHVERMEGESSRQTSPEYVSAFDYGYRAAGDRAYQGKRWEEVEPSLRVDYERNYPGSTWDRVKASVREGWDKLTGRR